MKVTHSAYDGSYSLIALRDQGELLGELASTDGHPRSATLRALTEVTILAITAARFERIRARRPPIEQAVQRTLTARLREADRHLALVGSTPVDRRLAGALLRLLPAHSRQERDGIRITLPLSQDDLAGLAFTSRRTIGRVLADWREAGWIVTGRRSVLLTDLPAIDQLWTT